MTRRVPFYRHSLGARELAEVERVFAGPILTTGDTVERFETELAAYLGCEDVVAVTSCTGALHLGLIALGIEPGDEVITTPMTFAATATAILQAGAHPVFVDVEKDTGNLDAGRVEGAVTPRTRAVLPVHLFGQMCDMQELRKIGDRHGVAIIEDAAHCVEGSRERVRPGQLSEAACFSFYATKNLTCGEGGAIAVQDRELGARLRRLRLHGMTKTAADRAREGYQPWDVVDLGWKYNMDNIHAAILRPQLERIEDTWKRRKQVDEWYRSRLDRVEGIELPAVRDRVKHAYHLFPVWIDGGRRDQVVSELDKRGVEVMVNYSPVHLLTLFRRLMGTKEGDFPDAERIGASTLSLPFYPSLTEGEVETVVEVLSQALEVARTAVGSV